MPIILSKEVLNFVLTATALQLPLNLHLWSSGFREESRDASFAEGARGESETFAVSSSKFVKGKTVHRHCLLNVKEFDSLTALIL